MKAGIYLILLISLLIGCKRDEEGEILSKFKFTTSQIGLKSANAGPDSVYSQFGDYITSVTPGHFSGVIGMLFYADTSLAGHGMGFLERQDSSQNELRVHVDFSNSQEVSLIPQLGSTDMVGNQYRQKEVTFVYFVFSAIYFYQEVELPIQYEEVTINQFNEEYSEHNSLGGLVRYNCDSVKFGTLLKIRSTPFVTRLFTGDGGYTYSFVFGNTDSSYIFNPDGIEVEPIDRFPIVLGDDPIIRSNKFVPETIIMPEFDEVLEMNSTISFDTENIIQIYAGQDNIPYTSDDIFLYAPNYWERINIKLESSLSPR